MTDTTDAIVEAMARAMCIATGKDPDKLTPAPRGTVGLVPLWTLWENQARAAIAAALPMLREVAAKCADKRTEDRFADFGVTEPDTNSSFYPGRCADIYYQLDEEDECVAASIRARFDELAKEIGAG